MQASKHPEYNEEKERLESTQKAIDVFASSFIASSKGRRND
jgi:hypothetical protein